MRITHVTCTDHFAGVEQYVADVSRHQAAEGHDLTVLGGSETGMRTALNGSEVEWRPAPTVRAAARALCHLETDLVHAHMTSAEIAAVLTKPIHRSPVIATLHFAQPRGSTRLRSQLLGLLPKFIDGQIAISDFVAAQSGAVSEVIPNGVPWDLPGAPRRPVVLMAQRLEREKDTATALVSWAGSRLGDEGWRLQIAGRGAELTALVELAHELGVDASVDFLGFVPDVRRRMTEASIFLATAPGEPFGLSVVEAMAAGTPVVARAGGAHHETVGTTEGATLYAPSSSPGCAEILRRLADDPDERNRYGEALRQRWAESFSLETHCARLQAVYDRVLARRTPNGSP